MTRYTSYKDFKAVILSSIDNIYANKNNNNKKQQQQQK